MSLLLLYFSQIDFYLSSVHLLTNIPAKQQYRLCFCEIHWSVVSPQLALQGPHFALYCVDQGQQRKPPPASLLWKAKEPELSA